MPEESPAWKENARCFVEGSTHNISSYAMLFESLVKDCFKHLPKLRTDYPIRVSHGGFSSCERSSTPGICSL